MNKPYAGLDYSGPGSTTNRNVETGIRYGVISRNSLSPEVLDCNDIEEDYGRPEDAECPECGTQCEVPENWGDSTHCPNCDEDFEVELPDMAEPIGWSYQSDGYKLCDCLDNDVFVIESPFYTYAQFCSPCVPGAGNLDNPFTPEGHSREQIQLVRVIAPNAEWEAYKSHAEDAGFPKTYCLGHDFFDKENPCPYPVFSVETGELVQPTNPTE